MRWLTPCVVIACIWFGGAYRLSAQNKVPTTDGNVLLVNALETVQRQASISARIRHQARLYEHKLVGNGQYYQQASESLPLTRWVMNTQVAGQTASYTQVFDGKYLWTDRRLPSGRQVHRLDVNLLHSRLKKGKTDQPSLSLSTQGQGGLAPMLAKLLDNFEFEQPRQTQLDGMPVLALIGHWREEELQRLWKEAPLRSAPEAASWPEQIPHHVLVLLGQNMFPYVIEHRRYDDLPLASSIAGLHRSPDPLVRYELYEVKFAFTLKKNLFEFPQDGGWKDETSLVLERLAKNQSTSRLLRAN